jgi:hypothetical protein
MKTSREQSLFVPGLSFVLLTGAAKRIAFFPSAFAREGK